VEILAVIGESCSWTSARSSRHGCAYALDEHHPLRGGLRGDADTRAIRGLAADPHHLLIDEFVGAEAAELAAES
jgi:hypothetical protein